jgi:hypothetical protein
MIEGYEIGEFEEDGALDERDELIAWLKRRIDSSLLSQEFSGVDVSGVRANLVILTTIIRNHGGGHLISFQKAVEWGRRLDEPFMHDERWAFEPWPEDVKSAWRLGCQQTVQALMSFLEE